MADDAVLRTLLFAGNEFRQVIDKFCVRAKEYNYC